MSKRYLKLFIEKIVIRLPKVDIVGKSEVVLAVLKNKKAVRTDGVLTALGSWLPGTDSLRFAQDKLTSGLGMPQEPENKSPTLGALFSGSPGRTAVRTTYHHYFLRDSSKLQVAHNPHYLSIKSRFGCRDHIYEDSRRFVFKRNSSGLNLL